MPTNVSLAAYLVKIRDVKEREDEILSHLTGEDVDFLEYLVEQLGAMKQAQHNEEYQQVLSVTKLRRTDRQISGLIETGDYGLESNIYSTVTKKVVHKRKKQEADLRPFYFMFLIPKELDEGLLILQRTGNYGIRKVLYRFLYDSFNRDFVDFRLHLDPIVDPSQLEKYSHGVVKELRFIKISLPADLADSIQGGHNESRGRMELLIKASRGRSLPDRVQARVARLLRRRERTGVFAMEDGNFEYDDVKIKTQVGGTSRTFSVGDPKIRSYYDVTERIELGAGGHPTLESIAEQAEALAERLMSELLL
jgi:hypothetical protein